MTLFDTLRKTTFALTSVLLLAACTITVPMPTTLPGTPGADASPVAASNTPAAAPVAATPIVKPTSVAAQPTPLPQIVLAATDVAAIRALENLNIRSGPLTAYPVVGRMAQGQQRAVLMVTADGTWWQVECPAGVPADCFVSADPTLTQPVSADPTPVAIDQTGGIVIESLEAVVLESDPVQVQAGLSGYIPNGCIRPYGVPQTREGNAIRLQIQTSRSGENCTQAIIPYNEVVGLDVSGWGPGVYYVAINNLWAEFELPGENAATPELPGGPEVISTDVQWVLARADIAAMQWPGPGDAVVGYLRAGEIAQVTGVTPDGGWWQIVCVQSSTPCYVSANFATPTAAPGADVHPVVPTNVQYVMAQVDTPLLEGPSANALPAGLLYAGMIARVSAVSLDGGWWRVECDVTQTTARECFVSADPSQTLPTAAP